MLRNNRLVNNNPNTTTIQESNINPPTTIIIIALLKLFIIYFFSQQNPQMPLYLPSSTCCPIKPWNYTIYIILKRVQNIQALALLYHNEYASIIVIIPYTSGNANKKEKNNTYTYALQSLALRSSATASMNSSVFKYLSLESLYNKTRLRKCYIYIYITYHLTRRTKSSFFFPPFSFLS